MRELSRPPALLQGSLPSQRLSREATVGWTCPPDASAKDQKLVAEVVGDALKEIIAHLLNRRPSDSFPQLDGEGEKIAGREIYNDGDNEWREGPIDRI